MLPLMPPTAKRTSFSSRCRRVSLARTSFLIWVCFFMSGSLLERRQPRLATLSPGTDGTREIPHLLRASADIVGRALREHALPDKPRQIIALGGGGFSMEPENPALDLYVLAQARSASPSVLFLPTASGDSDAYVVRFYQAFAEHPCR